MAYTLHIGEKNYSSWSARPWILMRGAGIPFGERLVSLRPDAENAARFGHLPAGGGPAPAATPERRRARRHRTRRRALDRDAPPVRRERAAPLRRLHRRRRVLRA